MDRKLLLIALYLLNTSCLAQWSTSFKSLRYNEDYSFLRHSESSAWYDKLKFAPLFKDSTSYVSFGGEMRLQYFFYMNEAWGEIPDDHDGFILNRFLTHSDIHLGKRFRLFVQLQGSGASGAVNPGPIDENPLDLHQVFAEYLYTSRQLTVRLRVGRQEFLYGAQRLISVREGPNTRNAFDAYKATFSTKHAQLDAFYGSYVMARPGIIDDRVNDSTRVWGLYQVNNKVPLVGNIDIYYLGLRKKFATFDDATGQEYRHSLGTRIWGNRKKWYYNVEGVYQVGAIGPKNISSWTLSADISYVLSSGRYSPTLGLKTEIISGDRVSDDGALQTFNPMFPRGAYFGLAAFIGPSNLIDLHPSFETNLTKNLSWSIDCDIFWRHQRSDGIYAPNVELIYSGDGTISRFIGAQLGTDLHFNLSPFVSGTAEVTWFDAGDFLKEAGPGKDILYLGMTTQLKF